MQVAGLHIFNEAISVDQIRQGSSNYLWREKNTGKPLSPSPPTHVQAHIQIPLWAPWSCQCLGKLSLLYTPLAPPLPPGQGPNEYSSLGLQCRSPLSPPLPSLLPTPPLLLCSLFARTTNASPSGGSATRKTTAGTGPTSLPTAVSFGDYGKTEKN